MDDLQEAIDENHHQFLDNLAMHTEALALINQNNVSIDADDSVDLEDQFEDADITPSSHGPNGDQLYRLAGYKMRMVDGSIMNDSDRTNLLLTCNLCKNDIGFGQPSFSCRGICDWDICSECVKPEIRDSH